MKLTRIALLRGDKIKFGGAAYEVGENMNLPEAMTKDDFIATHKEIEREFTVYPFGYCIFGGHVYKETRKVWVSKDAAK